MFQDEFVVKKGIFTSTGVNDSHFWQSKHDLIYHVAKVEAAAPFHG